MKKPYYYKVPLRRRKDIADYIFDATYQRFYNRRSHPFCFNVKAYKASFEFSHLLEIFRGIEGNPAYTNNDDWLASARERFEEHTQHLWEWGVEHATSHFLGRNGGEPDSDCYTHLWDGTSLDVDYSFEGQGGGWLSINQFQGCNFTGHGTTSEYWRSAIEIARWDDEDEPVMDYKTVLQLYQLVVMLKHDLQNPELAIEEGAAWAFFANVCSDIPQTKSNQRKFEFITECETSQ